MKVWLLSDIDPNKFSAFSRLAEKFRADYPEIKVDFSVKTRLSMWESFFLHVRNPQRNPLPDIVEIPHSWTRVLSGLDVLREINDVFDSLEPGDFMDFLADGMGANHRGDFFSLPWWMELYTLSYREDFLKDMQDPAGELSTWDGFVGVCSRLKKKSRRRDFYPLENSNPSGAFSLYDVLPCVWNRGGRLFNDEFTKSEASKIEVFQGISDFISLARNGHLPLFRENYYESRGLLSEGQRAMVFSGRMPACFLGKRGSPKLVPVLYPDMNRKGHFVSSVNLALGCKADEKEAGLFLKFVFSGSNIKFFTESFNVFPCLKKRIHQIFREEKFSAYREIVSKPRMTPDINILPTYEFLMNALLKDTAVAIAKGEYEEEELRKKLIIVQTQVDYILSSY